MPITRLEAIALAELICVVRPNWNARGVITKGLQPLGKHPAPLEVIAWAALRAAADRDVLTPAVIPLNGPHWNLADRPPAPRLTRDLECPKHVGQWAGNCPPCVSERIAQDDGEAPVQAEEHLTARERARATAKAAKRGLAIPDEHGPTCNPDRGLCTCGADQPPEYVHRADATPADPRPRCRHEYAGHDGPCELPPYGTPEHARAHHEKHPDRVGQAPETRRRMAAKDAMTEHEAREHARATGQLCDTPGCYWPERIHNHNPNPTDQV